MGLKSFFKKNSLWIGTVVKYIVVFLIIMTIGTFYFFWSSYWISTLIIIGVLFLGYFSPEMYRFFFKVKRYEGEYRQSLTELASRLDSKINDFYLKEDPRHNAFALGFPTKRFIAFNSATLTKCPWSEIEGVVAHEISHHKSNDALIYTAIGLPTFLIVAWVDNTLSMHNFTHLLFACLLTALIVLFIALGVSRWREHYADVFAKSHLGDTSGLVNFLKRVAKEYKELGYNSTEFFPQLNLFSVHISIDERIKYLTA